VNLQAHVPIDLWKAIKDAYEAENYSHAFLESTMYLTTLLRERAEVDGDGVTLVGLALGGDSPRLRINTLQTDSERKGGLNFL
jgi:hypothetical protein